MVVLRHECAMRWHFARYGGCTIAISDLAIAMILLWHPSCITISSSAPWSDLVDHATAPWLYSIRLLPLKVVDHADLGMSVTGQYTTTLAWFLGDCHRLVALDSIGGFAGGTCTGHSMMVFCGHADGSRPPKSTFMALGG